MSRVEIVRGYVLESVTIPSGSASTPKLNICQFAFGSYQMPAAIEGTLKWQVSVDEVVWTDADAITFAVNGSLKIPDTCWDFPACRVTASVNQTAARVFSTFRKG